MIVKDDPLNDDIRLNKNRYIVNLLSLVQNDTE